MANRNGTYLSDENVRLRCVMQTPPMSKTYGLFKTPNVDNERMPQRPQNPAALMLAMSRAKGIPYPQLKQQYMNGLSLVPRQTSIVVGGLNRGRPTPAPSLTPVVMAAAIAGGGVPLGGSGSGTSSLIPPSGGGGSSSSSTLPPAPSGGGGSSSSANPAWYTTLFGHQPTKAAPIRSRPIIIPVVPNAAQLAAQEASRLRQLGDISKIAHRQPRVGDSNSPTIIASSSTATPFLDETMRRATNMAGGTITADAATAARVATGGSIVPTPQPQPQVLVSSSTRSGKAYLKPTVT